MKTICIYCECLMAGDSYDEVISHATCQRCKPLAIALLNGHEVQFIDPNDKFNKGIEDPEKVVPAGWTWPDFLFYQRSIGRSVIELIL